MFFIMRAQSTSLHSRKSKHSTKQKQKTVLSLLALEVSASLLFAGCTPKTSSAVSSSLPPSETSSSVLDSSFSLSSSLPESQHNPYSNPTYPIVNGNKTATYMADPYVLRDDDGYFYLYCTQTYVYTTDNLSDGKKFQRCPIFRSTDCVNWKYYGNVFDGYEPTWGTSGAGVWAPTVYKIGDTYNFYYALSTGGDKNPGIGLATSPTPYGPWTHQGKLFDSDGIGVVNSIDPYVFVDDGHVYMAFGSFGGYITLIELTADGKGLLNGLDYQKENKVKLAGYGINDVNNYEATIILKKNGYYYLFLSTGTCCSGSSSTYHVVVSRSENVAGPYTDSQGRDMFHPNHGDSVVVPSMSGVMGPGHCGLIEDDLGEVWMIYHGYDTKDTSHSEDRVLYLDKLIFGDTGYPHVDTYKASDHVTKNGPYLNSLEANQ
jgi:arabinan endo-1,5-alpha-L-arabinosidase